MPAPASLNETAAAAQASDAVRARPGQAGVIGGPWHPSKCPLCQPDTPATQPVVADPPHAVVRCTACGLVRLNDHPSPDAIQAYVSETHYGFYFGELDKQRTYDATELRRLSAWKNARYAHHRLERLLRRVGVDPRQPLRVHDIGCAEGFHLALGREQGWKVTGNDLSPERRDFGRRSLGVDFALEPFTVLAARATEAGDAPLDVVTLRHVLEHLPEPLRELAAIQARLRPGGVLYLEVPNFASPELRLKIARHRRGWRRKGLGFMGVPEHLWQFSARTLRALLARAGFDLALKTTTSTATNHGAFVRALLSATYYRLGFGGHLVVLARKR